MTQDMTLLMLDRLHQSILALRGDIATLAERPVTVTAQIPPIEIPPVEVSMPQVPPPPPAQPFDSSPLMDAMGQMVEDVSSVMARSMEQVGEELGSVRRTIEAQATRSTTTIAKGGTGGVVKDFYPYGELIAPISGAGGVVDISFVRAVHEVWLRSDGATSYFNPFGGVADTDAIPLNDGEWVVVNVKTGGVSVYAASGATVRGYAMGYRL